jgi:hypothetical protein
VADPKGGIEVKPPSLSDSRIITMARKKKKPKRVQGKNLEGRKNLYLRYRIEAIE